MWAAILARARASQATPLELQPVGFSVWVKEKGASKYEREKSTWQQSTSCEEICGFFLVEGHNVDVIEMRIEFAKKLKREAVNTTFGLGHCLSERASRK